MSSHSVGDASRENFGKQMIWLIPLVGIGDLSAGFDLLV